MKLLHLNTSRDELMKSKILVLLMLAPLHFVSAAQDTEEFSGQVTGIFIGKSELIKVGVAETEDAPLNCYSDETSSWQLHFNADMPYSNNWFDILNLVRSTREPIKIGYTPNSDSTCAIEYLALMKAKDYGSGEVPNDNLTRTGNFGNIALNGTNGLHNNSYSANGFYNADAAYSAFDGFTYTKQLSVGVGEKTNRSIWLIRKDNKAYPDQQYWLQIEFNEFITVSGFRVVVSEKGTELGRSPKSIIIQSSDDGENFVTQETFRLSKLADQRINLTEKSEFKYFRVLIESNWGDTYIEIDELEVYAN
jgi:hypothetical protein